MKPDKPVFGQPCNGCGLCCLMEPCPISVEAFGLQARCPALVDAGGRFACGFITNPDQYFKPEVAAEAATMIGEALGIGQFCDAVATDIDRAAEVAMGRPFG